MMNQYDIFSCAIISQLKRKIGRNQHKDNSIMEEKIFTINRLQSCKLVIYVLINFIEMKYKLESYVLIYLDILKSKFENRKPLIWIKFLMPFIRKNHIIRRISEQHLYNCFSFISHVNMII